MNPLVPPTPTPLPPGPTLPFVINAQQWRIWNFTDESIMAWQMIGPSRTQMLQIAIITIIVIIAAALFMMWIRGLSE